MNNNLTMHTDKYQLNMVYSHFKENKHNEIRVFDAYFRKLPFGNGYAVFAGLERIVDYINNLKFTEEDIEYLKKQPENYSEDFLDELRNFKFTGNIHSFTEGTFVFPNEPLIRVEARILEAQIVETAILNFMNFQTLIATKASRIKQVSPDSKFIEMGTRRAQEADAALWGARAAYISGFESTSNVKAGFNFNIPITGTHAHAFVMEYETELEAFRAYARTFPNDTTLLVDTYNTLKSGVPNAIIVAKELEAKGHKLKAIRLDSGDLAYLSKTAREMLDKENLNYVKIVASNDLDEKVIFNLKTQDAKIDIYGVGTQLITAADNPSLGGVYKLSAKKVNDEYIPVIKVSENPEKVTTPGLKQVYRIINKKTYKVEADYICFDDEFVDGSKELKLFDPINTWQSKIVSKFEAKQMLVPIFINGEQVYDLPSLDEIRGNHNNQFNMFWDEHLRKLNPQKYYVDLSDKLWNEKFNLLNNIKKKTHN